MSTEIQCSPLDPPVNGMLTDGNCGTTYGDQCAVSCQAGFSHVRGDDLRQCHASPDATCDDGYWTGQHPVCLGKLSVSNIIQKMEKMTVKSTKKLHMFLVHYRLIF